MSIKVCCSVVGHCRQCKELDNQARSREDFTLYRAMMKTIRRMEEDYKDGSHFIFIIQVGTVRRGKEVMLCFPQEPDLRYLIENIWGCQSALSGEKDLFELMMVRWDCSKPSPGVHGTVCYSLNKRQRVTPSCPQQRRCLRL